ncbi:hypothetical protein DFH09DRAFT_1362151 [Mycena vulgaris]|nr:hypothetical protein DFH09DRAFT_1362151 [Mycena vulgaris]
MSSPFTSKLGTNFCPQDKEILEIQTLLLDSTRRLALLDAEITDLQKAIDKLADERERLGAYVDAHKALLSPIRRLPLDIIEEIFAACIPTHRNCVMSAVEAPVLLGRICSSWRTISLSTPRLWSRLHIAVPKRTPNSAALFDRKLALRLETAKVWLGRSAQCPLSLSLDCALYTDASSATQIIQALLPFALRWEHVVFVAPSSVLVAFSHLTELDVPILQSVHMSETFDRDGVIFRAEALRFLGGSNIHSAYISGANFTPLELPLRWNGLTDLSIIKLWNGRDPILSIEASLQVLSQCPQLRTCRLVVDDEADDSHSDIGESRFELPFLHTLVLDCIGDSSTIIPQLFSRHSLFAAAAPRIESLDLSIEFFSSASLSDFLHGIPLVIREIKFNTYSASDQTPSRILGDEMLELLSPSPDFPTPCCPDLEVLEINCRCSLSENAVLRLINSRTALKRLVVRFAREIGLDIRSQHVSPRLATLGRGISASLPRALPRALHPTSPVRALQTAPWSPARTDTSGASVWVHSPRLATLATDRIPRMSSPPRDPVHTGSRAAQSS